MKSIILRDHEVRAVLAGTKSQMKRPVDLPAFDRAPTPGYDWTWRGQAPIRSIAQQRRQVYGCWQEVRHDRLIQLCPLGVPGDTLWVRECWGISRGVTESDRAKWEHQGWPLWYRAGDSRVFRGAKEGGPAFMERGRWRPSIHMPRWASRLTLRVTAVRVQRVQDVSEEDARAEGAPGGVPWLYADESYRTAFRHLWNDTHGAESWERNDWIWAVTFEVCRGG
jgi:hypothetical protein